MTDVTELLLPVRRTWRAGWRSGDGRAVDVVVLGAVLLLLVAVTQVGGSAAPSQAQIAAPAALPVVAAPSAVAVPSAAAPAIVAGKTPNVVGAKRDEAAAALLAAGYRTISWIVESGHSGPPGSVARQEPAADSPVQPRGAARLFIAK